MSTTVQCWHCCFFYRKRFPTDMTFRMNEEFSFMHPVIHETIKVGPTEKYFKEGLKLVHSTKEAFALLIQRAWV